MRRPPALAVLVSIVLIGSGCQDPEPPHVSRQQANAAMLPALGCWDFSTVFGSSVYVPDHWRVRLDTTIINPTEVHVLLRLGFDSTRMSHFPLTRQVRLAHWAPYPNSDRVFVFWGDGFTGVAARLRRSGDRMGGWRTETADASG